MPSSVVWVSSAQQESVVTLQNNKNTFDIMLIQTQNCYFNRVLYKSFIIAIMRHIFQLMIVYNMRSTQRVMLRTIYNVGAQ